MKIAIALPVTKPCPACASEKTTILPYSGFERLLAFATGLLKYRCVSCGESFHAADRRQIARSGNAVRIIHRR